MSLRLRFLEPSRKAKRDPHGRKRNFCRIDIPDDNASLLDAGRFWHDTTQVIIHKKEIQIKAPEIVIVKQANFIGTAEIFIHEFIHYLIWLFFRNHSKCQIVQNRYCNFYNRYIYIWVKYLY